MAIKDLVKLNGETSNLPVRRESDYSTASPFREMTEWMNEWDRVFDNFLNRAFSLSPSSNFNSGLTTGNNRWGSFVPAVNIRETDNEFHVTAELPGMTENDIEIYCSKGNLTIKGEKKLENEEKGQNYYRMERSYGAFNRTIPLPEAANLDKVDASFRNGVLTITLPKLTEAQSSAKRINIRTEK